MLETLKSVVSCFLLVLIAEHLQNHDFMEAVLIVSFQYLLVLDSFS